MDRHQFKSKIEQFFLNSVDVGSKLEQIITLFDSAREVNVTQDFTAARAKNGIFSYIDKEPGNLQDLTKGLVNQLRYKASPAAYAFHAENLGVLTEIQYLTSQPLTELAKAYIDCTDNCSNDNIKGSIFELMLTKGENWYYAAQDCQDKACEKTNALYEKIIKYTLSIAIVLFASTYYLSSLWFFVGCVISLLASLFAINERYFAII